MYALVESGSITKIFTNPKGFVLNNNQYPADIFSKWTKAEKEAIGIYEIETDSSNKKDDKWYINTNESYTCQSIVTTGYAMEGYKRDIVVVDRTNIQKMFYYKYYLAQ